MTQDVTDTTRFRSLIPQISLFAGLSDQALQRLAESAKRRSYAPGDIVIEYGSNIAHLFVVESGLLAASVPDRHNTMTEVARFGAGEYCGEMSLIRAERADAVVEAVTESQVWLVPHTVIGEIAEREPAVMRELASVVASRLSDTNERIRQLRPGRAVACISNGSPWAAAVVGQIGVSAARHLTRPVLLVDLATDAPALPPDAHQLPSVAEIIEDEGLLAQFEAFALEDGPRLAVAARGAVLEVDTARLIALLTEVRRNFQLVILHLPDIAAIEDSVLEELDGPILIWTEDEDLGDLAVARRFIQGETVILQEQPSEPKQRDLTRLRTEREANVLKIVTGGIGPLQQAAPPPTRDEPWASIDWLARHFIKRKVGLALGAGGAKGYAHLGVMERLRALGVPIDFTAGASIGAPLAAGVADERAPGEIRRLMDELFRDALKPTSLRPPWNALTSNRALTRGFEQLADGRVFEDLRIPVAVVAADIITKQEVVFTEGDPVTAMLASFAIPGIFPPVELDGQLLVDGGFLNPVPIDTVATLGADIVIGVELNEPQDTARVRTPRRRWPLRSPPIISTLSQTFEMIMWKLNAEGSAQADVSIVPRFDRPIGLNDYKQGDDIVEAGRVATDRVYADLKELFPWIL